MGVIPLLPAEHQQDEPHDDDFLGKRLLFRTLNYVFCMFRQPYTTPPRVLSERPLVGFTCAGWSSTLLAAEHGRVSKFWGSWASDLCLVSTGTVHGGSSSLDSVARRLKWTCTSPQLHVEPNKTTSFLGTSLLLHVKLNKTTSFREESPFRGPFFGEPQNDICLKTPPPPACGAPIFQRDTPILRTGGALRAPSPAYGASGPRKGAGWMMPLI